MAIDVILDFDDAGNDEADLSAIDANTTTGGNQAFTWRGTNALGGAGQARGDADGNDVLLTSTPTSTRILRRPSGAS